MRALAKLWTGLLVAFIGGAAAGADDGRLFDYRDVTLDNGLRVVTLEDFSCPIVAVQLWYHVGSKDENPERQGFAHMFEHMMFQGTDRLGPTGHFDTIHKVGGDCNAYTAFDNTTYVQTLPASQLDVALYLEAERMSFLRIDQKSFDTERKVVEEERRLGLNAPYGTVAEQLLEKIFSVHPYRWSPIGKIPHLRAAAVQELRDFWTTYYVPNNATLVVVGAVKHEEVQAKAKAAFGWIPRGADPPRVTVREPLPDKPRTLTIKEKSAPVPITGSIYPGVPTGHKDTTALTMMLQILGGSESSRLHRAIVADNPIAAVAIAAPLSMEHHGIIGVAAVMLPIGGDMKRVKAAIDAEVARMCDEPVTAEELDMVRTSMLSSTVAGRLTVESKAQAIGEAAVIANDIDSVNRQIDEIRAVTVEDIQRVARQYLDAERVTKVTVERNLLGMILGGKGNPEDSAPITAKPEEVAPPPGRPGVVRPASIPAEPPIAAAEPFKATPEFESATLDNGLRVIVVENHEIPWVSVRLGLDSGAWSEPRAGVASMAATLITKGTQNYTEKELTLALDREAISLVGSVSGDSGSVSASCVTDKLPLAVELLAEVVQRPTFPEKEFDKARKQARTGMAVQEQEPSYLAERELRRRMYGAHPYARTATGETADLDAMSPSDPASWWTKFVRPDLATLIFAGDVTLPQAVELSKRHFGMWVAAGPRPHKALAIPPDPKGTSIVLVDKPGSVQSQIRVGSLAIPVTDPAYPLTSVVNGYFGGAFGARLNEEIRVKRGLTYGASGGFNGRRFFGQFVVSTFSKTESTAAAVEAVLGEIKRLREEPPSETELADTKSHFLGGFVGARETPQAVAGEIWSLAVLGLPPTFNDTLVAKVSAAGAEECLALARHAVDPEKLIIVVVGDAAALKEGLEKIGTVEVVTAAPEADAPAGDAPAEAQPPSK